MRSTSLHWPTVTGAIFCLLAALSFAIVACAADKWMHFNVDSWNAARGQVKTLHEDAPISLRNVTVSMVRNDTRWTNIYGSQNFGLWKACSTLNFSAEFINGTILIESYDKCTGLYWDFVPPCMQSMKATARATAAFVILGIAVTLLAIIFAMAALFRPRKCSNIGAGIAAFAFVCCLVAFLVYHGGALKTRCVCKEEKKKDKDDKKAEAAPVVPEKCDIEDYFFPPHRRWNCDKPGVCWFGHGLWFIVAAAWMAFMAAILLCITTYPKKDKDEATDMAELEEDSDHEHHEGQSVAPSVPQARVGDRPASRASSLWGGSAAPGHGANGSGVAEASPFSPPAGSTAAGSTAGGHLAVPQNATPGGITPPVQQRVYMDHERASTVVSM